MYVLSVYDKKLIINVVYMIKKLLNYLSLVV